MPGFLDALAKHLGTSRQEAMRRFRAWAHDDGMDTPIDVTVAVFAVNWFYKDAVRG